MFNDFSFSGSPPNASDTSFVVAKLIPEVARVKANPYTLEIKVKSPIATAPILLLIYILNATET